MSIAFAKMGAGVYLYGMEIDQHPDDGSIKKRPILLPGLKHYYGDITRKFFLLGGVLMIFFAPLYPNLLPVNNLFVVVGAIGLSVFAGITNPKQFWVNIVDTILAVLSFVIFEAAIFQGHSGEPWLNMLFLVRQAIALIFFFALYYSVKTLRGMMVK